MSLIYDHCLEPYGLTVTQYSLLGHVRALDGIGIGALADALVMDPTTLTRNLKPLLVRKLLVLVPDVKDRRNRNLHLTEAGRDSLRAARPGWEMAQKQVALALGEKDEPHLAKLIDTLLETLAA